HMLGDSADELLEIVGAGNEVRLAVQLHKDAQLAVVVDVAAHEPLRSSATGAALGLGDSLLAKVLDSLLHVAAVGLEGLLAVHHSGAGATAELLNVLCGECCSRHSLNPRFMETPPVVAGGVDK